MNTRDAAHMLGTDARTLRMFLRADPTFTAVGQGKRYSFGEKDEIALRKRFPLWLAKRTKATSDIVDVELPDEEDDFTPDPTERDLDEIEGER